MTPPYRRMNGGLLCVVSMTVLAASGCGEAPPPHSGVFRSEPADKALDPNGPRIAVDEPFQDFGAVLSGTPLVYEFTIRNPGKDTLKITHEKTSCGCTAAVVTDREIPPGGRGTLRVMYTPKGTETFSNHVRVFHNVEGFEPARLDIVGTSRPSVKGPRLIGFGRLVSGTPAERVVPLDVADGTDVNVIASGTTLSFLDAGVARDEDGRMELTVTFDGNPAPQTFHGWVWLDTDRTEDERVKIPVSGTIVADLRAEPSQVYLGRVSAGQEVSRSVRVTGARGGMDDLEVEVAGPPWITATVASVGSAADLTVSLAGEAKPGRTVARVRVRQPGREWIEIPVQGFVN